MASAPPLTSEEGEFGFQPFAGATGRGRRVAVIDSGVNGRHPHIIRAVDGGVSVGDDGEFAAVDYTDLIGHGTAVMAAIQEKVPDAHFFAVRVFNTALRTTAANRVRALQWCIEHKMDVVNLSLGTTNPAHAKKFEQVAAEAADGGTLLVAARGVDGGRVSLAACRACSGSTLIGIARATDSVGARPATPLGFLHQVTRAPRRESHAHAMCTASASQWPI
jgi:subtilisin family serine protease